MPVGVEANGANLTYFYSACLVVTPRYSAAILLRVSANCGEPIFLATAVRPGTPYLKLRDGRDPAWPRRSRSIHRRTFS